MEGVSATGIHVLIGAAAARAGMHAPIAFLLAAIIMGFSTASFAELGGRLPLAAGEAADVRSAVRVTSPSSSRCRSLCWSHVSSL
jgi:amino acid transporter